MTIDTQRVNLMGMTLAQLEQFFLEMGEKKYRAAQVAAQRRGAIHGKAGHFIGFGQTAEGEFMRQFKPALGVAQFASGLLFHHPCNAVTAGR